MSLQDKYKFNSDGDFESKEEYEEAVRKGDIKTNNARPWGWDQETGQDYWPDGTKR